MNRSNWFAAEGEDGLPEVLWEDGERRFCSVSRTDADGTRHTCMAVVPVMEHANPAFVARLAHEYSFKDALDGAWALRPLELVRNRGQTILVLEFQAGEPLDCLIGRAMEAGQFLRLAIALAAALHRMHERGIVHRDLKPANILFDAANDRAWLTGFGIATRLPRERPAPEPPELIAGTLSHMAPEQTGRMNRSIDSRSDLYSLGVTLYQALTGNLPFTASDPMEWVHCHIARRPARPTARVGNVPPLVSEIIMKLLAKAPEERYQTAAGVEHDLRRCWAEWRAREVIEFPLGERDTADRLLIPEKLYGRTREVEALLAAFRRIVEAGPPELVLVSGYSGVGKSSVVNELHKVLVPTCGLFASGKFDQLKRDIPYASVADALRDLIRHLLGKPEIELCRWRDDLRQALDPIGALMIALIPELKSIIGEQPPVPEVASPAAKERFQLALRRLIGVFARPEHPLALFLDDLQWLDGATLDLLEHIFARGDLQHLLLVGAYRNNEVDAAHPLMRKLAALRERGAAVEEIVLAPLNREDLAQLIANALHVKPQRAMPLADLVHEKTGGNPFFANQFVQELVEEGLITFEPRHARWRWDLDSIRAKGYTSNVVDLLVGRLSRLPPNIQRALSDLACLGNMAKTSTLVLVREAPEPEIHSDLWEARRSELIVRTQNSYRFVHDRVREAAYALIPEGLRGQTHLRIGRLLKAHADDDRRAEVVFEIVGQLNRAATLLTSQDEREQLAVLNLAAGKRARAAAAYAPALSYLVAGASILDMDCWQRRHDLVFELELQRAECEFLTSQMTLAEERLTMLSSRVANAVERAAVACLMADVQFALQRADRGVAECLLCLHDSGLDIPLNPTDAQAQAAYERIWSKLNGRAIENIAELPVMTDAASRWTLDLLAKVIITAHAMNKNLLCLASCAAVELSLERGNSDSSCFGYEFFGIVAGWQFGDFEAGFRFGRLGLDLVERKGLRRFDAIVHLCFAFQVMPWVQHVGSSQGLMRTAFDLANKSGDRISAVVTSTLLVSSLVRAGEPLAEVEKEAEASLAFTRRVAFGDFIDVADAQAALIRTLRGQTRQFGSFDDERFDEIRMQEHFAKQPHLPTCECWYWIFKLQARFLAGDYAAALDASVRAQGLLWSAPALLEQVDYEFYSALAHAAVCNATSTDEGRQHLEAVAAHHRRLDLWARHCPANFGNRAALVAAEIARIEVRDTDAMRLYEQSIRLARENGFLHHEALAAELCARFYAARGFDRISRAYLRDARHGYLQWGADAKVRQLEERHPELGEAGAHPSATVTIQTPVERLDLATVLKVSQAVSGETDFEKLIATVMRLAMEHAGAERGLMVLPQGDAHRIEAEAKIDRDGVQVELRQSNITAEDLPESVFQYVLRTRQRVLLQDASAEDRFRNDEYVRRHRTRSVLCMPLLKQTRLIGVAYLENNLAAGVFTPAKAALVELLASEAAVSLENARLYCDLQEREAKVRRLVDSNIIGIILWHADGRVIDANDAMARIIGHSRQDLISGRVRWPDFIPPESLESASRVVQEAREVGVTPTREWELLRKDGTRAPVLAGGASFEGRPDEGVSFILDLTELKRTEQALRESERESQRIVNTIPGLVAILAPSGEVAVVNDELVRYCGQQVEAMRQWGTNGTVHGDDVPRIAPLFAHGIATGEPYDFEARIRRFDGTYHWHQVRGLPLRATNGLIARWYVLLSDIDGRKLAEEGIRASERQLRLITDTIPALAWSARPDGSAEFFNQHYLEFVGLSAQRASDGGWMAAVHPDDLSRLAATWQSIMSSGQPGEAEARLRRHDGEYRWFLIRVNPLRDETGDIVNWYGVNTDIEDRKRAEVELKRAYDSFADAQRLSRTGNFTTDPVADVHVWSAELYRIFEIDPGQKITVQAVRERIHPEDLATFDAAFARSVLTGSDFDLSWRIVTPSARLKHLHCAARLIEKVAGRPLFIGAIQDVTDNITAGEALNRARSELAHFARVMALSALTASIAHEVNQPLSGIITNASTCLRMLDADPPNIDGARETARRTIRDGNRASDVVARLRALFSKKDFSPEPMDLNEATREVIALSLSDLQRDRVAVQPELSEDLPAVVGDRIQLQQVILNLLRNASDAMVGVNDRPRQLVIRTGREGEESVRLTVRDAGVGIDRQSMDKIFDAFYTTKSGGMGIGLSVSRSIVEQHRGRLWAEPNDGPGASFSFSIPAVPVSAGLRRPEPPQ